MSRLLEDMDTDGDGKLVRYINTLNQRKVFDEFIRV